MPSRHLDPEQARRYAEAGVEAAGDLLFELAVPFRSLAVTTDDPVHFYVELLREEQ